MNIAILAIVLVFMFVLRIQIRKSDQKMRQEEQDFWAHEEKANFTRRKSLDNLSYIKIPDNISLLFKKYNNDELLSLINEDTKIVNFNGIPNTELKLKYGAPNINLLSEYDKNFTTMITEIQHICAETENLEDRKELLEFAIDAGSDISGSFDMLSDIYIEKNTPAKIHQLIKKAEATNGLTGKRIVDLLNKKLENCT